MVHGQTFLRMEVGKNDSLLVIRTTGSPNHYVRRVNGGAWNCVCRSAELVCVQDESYTTCVVLHSSRRGQLHDCAWCVELRPLPPNAVVSRWRSLISAGLNFQGSHSGRRL